MKRFTLLLTILLTCVSCMEICQPDACVCVHDIDTENVTYRDILTYLTEYKGLKQTRAMEVSIEPILFEEDTVMYLINYEEGWELISADKRAPLHISRSDYGHMNIDKLYDNPGKKIYLNSIASKIYSLRNSPEAKLVRESNLETRSEKVYTEDSTYVSLWSVLSPDDLVITDPITMAAEVWTCIGVEKIASEEYKQEHLLKTKWDQDSPWNYYAPLTSPSSGIKCYTGCTMVAGAQVLYYLHNKIGKPQSAYSNIDNNLFIPASDTSLTVNPNLFSAKSAYYSTVVWDAMPMADSTSTITLGERAVSTLMAQLGCYASATYRRYSNSSSPAGTSAGLDNLQVAFRDSLDIDCIRSSSLSESQMLYYIYNQKLPIIVHATGTRLIDSTSISHAFVIDGVKYTKDTYKYTYIKSNTITPEYKYENKWVYNYDIQINWGYSGTYDNGPVYNYGDDGLSDSDGWYDLDCEFWAVGNNSRDIYDTRHWYLYNFN